MSRKRTLAFTCAAWYATFAAGAAEDPLREKARRLHRGIIVLDTHADMSALFEKDNAPPRITDPGMAGPGYDPSQDGETRSTSQDWTKAYPPGPWSFGERHQEGFLDLPRMRQGGLNAEFFSIFMQREPRPGMAVKRSLDYIDSVRSLCRRYSKDIALATTAAEVREIVRSGRIAALMGMEGGHMIEDDLRVLRLYHLLGVRYLTLTHCFNTNWADSSGCGAPVKPQHDGLSPFGREVVKELNRLGIMVDVTHVADKTFYDALAVTRAPVIASHSSVDGIKEHARNMSDDMLKALAKNGGVIQINAVIKYIDPAAPSDAPLPAPGNTPLSVFIDHILHALEVAGPDHVGIGIDFGYTAPTPVGLRDVSDFENITYELLKRGVDEGTIKKIWGENTLRVMAAVERVAARQGE
jgi:membrane dipeptidase